MDWNERFSGEEFHFGEAPAAFVRDHMGGLGAGVHVLTIAEGEGRDAVWLARQGCRVVRQKSGCATRSDTPHYGVTNPPRPS